MTIYKKFKKLNIDTMPLGLEEGDEEELYFCTPKGAKPIGRTGLDGIHFCFIKGFGEMVFAVSPMNTPGDYVHPIAKDFSDFLSLLIACGDTTALEQVHRWKQEEFDSFLEDNPINLDQVSVLENISEKLGLQAMEDPFKYIKELQSNFDYSKVKFTEDYEDFIPAEPKLPPWKVYFEAGFWDEIKGQRAGKEISINKEFSLNKKTWYIPSLYTSSKGLIIDFCVEIPIESIQIFIKKWRLSPKDDYTDFSIKEQIQIEVEHPMAINFSPEIVLNGKTIPASYGSSLSWNPTFPELNSLEAEGVLKRYGLDSTNGWVIWRSAFPWQTKRRPKISSLELTIKHDPVQVLGPYFSLSKAGENIDFINPLTNTSHRLTVEEYERKEIPSEGFMDKDYDFPNHCIAMTYTINPDLTQGSFSIRDCNHGDRPRKRNINPMDPHASAGAMAIAVIGGSDRPSLLADRANNQMKLHASCSSLYFNPIDRVEWQIIFHKKPCEDMTIKLI